MIRILFIDDDPQAHKIMKMVLEDGYVVSFTLPKGSYATNLMREFMKSGEEHPDPTEEAT